MRFVLNTIQIVDDRLKPLMFMDSMKSISLYKIEKLVDEDCFQGNRQGVIRPINRPTIPTTSFLKKE